MGTAGSVTVAVTADSTQLRTEMVKNQTIIKQFAQQAQQAGQAAAGGMQAAAASSAVLSQGLAGSTAAAGGLATAMGVLRGAIMTAFPVAGAFALFEILEKIANNKYAQVARDIADGFQSMNLSAATSIDTFKLSTAKMQEQIDLLTGKRPNTLAEELADASLAADKLAESLENDNKKIRQLLESQKLSAFQGMISGFSGTSDVTGSITGPQGYMTDIAHLAAVYDHAVRNQSPDADADLKALNDKKAAARRWQSDQLEQYQRAQAERATVGGPDQSANIAILQGFGDTLNNADDLQADEKQNKATAIQLKKIEDAKKYAQMMSEAQRKAQEELLKNDEEQEKKQNAFNKLTINEEIQFWTERISAFVKGSDQYRQVQDKIYDLIAKRPSLFSVNKKNQAEDAESTVKGQDLANRGAAELLKLQTQETERLDKETQKYNQELARGAELQQKAGAAFAESSVQMAVLQGSMSKLDAAQLLARIHADDHAASLARINSELQQQINLINQLPDKEMSPDEKQAAIRNAQQSASNAQVEVNGAYGRTQQQDQQAIASQQLGPAISQALGRMVNDWTNMTQSIVQVMTRAIDSFNDDIAKAMTGHGSKASFGSTFTQAGEGLAKTALQGAEGSILHALHLGGGKKADGSQGNPFYVVMATGPTAAAGSTVGSVVNTGVSSVMHGIGGWLSSIFQGGHAGGGDVVADRPALVGEAGPELFVPHAAGKIVPNHELGRSYGGGNTTIHVDARGSNDPAAIHAAVMRAAPHIVAAGVQTQHQHQMRRPQGR